MKKDILKLLAVIVSPGFYTGGAENAAMALSRNLAVNKCIKVTVATMANENREIIEGGILVKKFKNRIPPIIPGPYRNVLIRPSKLLVEEIKKEKYDVVHISNTHPAIAVAKIAKKCIKEKIPYVVSTYGIVEASTINETFKKNILVKLFSKFLVNTPLIYALSKADKIATSTEYERIVLSKYKIKKEKVKVTYIGIDSEIYKENKNLINIKNKFSINDKDAIILFVGVIKENKGIDILIKAVTNLINCKILIVGGVAQKNYYEYLLKLIKNLKLKNKIIFTGFVDKDLLKSLYHGCDIFVLPTKADTLPSCIVDAMACKKPVVSTKVGGIPELIDSTNGFLVKSGDYNKLSKALQKLINDENLRIKMGERGYQKIKKEFSWKKVAGKVLKIYKNLVPLK